VGFAVLEGPLDGPLVSDGIVVDNIDGASVIVGRGVLVGLCDDIGFNEGSNVCDGIVEAMIDGTGVVDCIAVIVGRMDGKEVSLGLGDDDGAS
jgi:hypothetical protein